MNSEQQLFTTVLILGLLLGLFGLAVLKNLKKTWAEVQAIRENNKKFRAKQEEVKKMKEKGDLHEWITVPSINGEIMVCKKTGWSPTLNGFIPMDLLNDHLFKIQIEKEYKEYRNKRVSKLAAELGFTETKMEDVVEKIFSMKKDFHVERMARLAEEFAKRAENVGKQD